MVERATLRRLVGALLAIGLLLGATAVTVAYFTDLQTLLQVLERGQWPWITAAVAVQVAYFVAYAAFYRLGFAVVGVSSRTWSLVPVVFAGQFVNLLVPTGAGAAAVFVDDAVRRGQNGARTMVGVVLVLLLDLLALLPFLAWGMTYLMTKRMFALWQLLSAAAFVMYVILLVALLALSRAKEASVCRVLGWVSRGINRVLGWVRLHGPAADWPARTAAELADAAAAIVANPGRLALAGIAGMFVHVLLLCCLWLFLRGFGADVPLGGLIAAYALGIVLFVVGVIPQLAPLSQGFMTATFIGVGVAAGPAVAAPLAFRGLLIGLPLVIGLPCAWRLGRFRIDARRASTAACVVSASGVRAVSSAHDEVA